MAPLRVAVLDAMAERRQQTGFIPSTSLLVDVWRRTEEGSGLRKMLIEWAAEHSKYLCNSVSFSEYFRNRVRIDSSSYEQ
jgi:hypothetical protein